MTNDKPPKTVEERKKRTKVAIPLEEKGLEGRLIILLRNVGLRHVNSKNLRQFGIECIKDKYTEQTAEGNVVFNMPKLRSDYENYLLSEGKGVKNPVNIIPIEEVI